MHDQEVFALTVSTRKPTFLESVASNSLDKRIWLWAERILEDVEGQLHTSSVAERFREDAIAQFIRSFDSPSRDQEECKA